MGLLFKVFVTVVLSFLNIFTFPAFGFFAGEDNYTVKDTEEIGLHFAAISDIHMTDEFARVQVLKCGLWDMDHAHDELDALVRAGDLPDQGRADEFENLKKAFELGADAVVIGKAITNPMAITKYFLSNVPEELK